MSIWAKNGKIIVNGNGRPIECDHCPCDNKIYAVYLYHTYACDPEKLPSGSSEPVAKEVIHYVNPEYPDQDNGKDFAELRQTKPDGEYLPEGWYSECAKYNLDDGNFFYTWDENQNLHTWFFMKDADPIDFINPVYNLQYMSEKKFLGTLHGNLYECEAPEIPDVPENAKQWLRITYSANEDYSEWVAMTRVFGTAHPFCSVPFGDGETISFLDACKEEETEYHGVWRGGTMCPADAFYRNEEERDDALCPIVVDIPYEVCGELSEDLIDRAIEENMPEDDRLEDCTPMCALFLAYVKDCPLDSGSSTFPPVGEANVKMQRMVDCESLLLPCSKDFFYIVNETDKDPLPDGWYSPCEQHKNDYFFIHDEQEYYSIKTSGCSNPSDSGGVWYWLIYVPYSHLVKRNFDSRGINPNMYCEDGGFPFVQYGERPHHTRWLSITYTPGNNRDWTYSYEWINTLYPFLDAPFGDGNSAEVVGDCNCEGITILKGLWKGDCMNPHTAVYNNDKPPEDRCPIVCAIPYEICGYVPQSEIDDQIKAHTPNDDQLNDCLVSYIFVSHYRKGQTFTSLHTEIYDVSYIHHKEEYDGEIIERDEEIRDYVGVGAIVYEEVYTGSGTSMKELARWVVDAGTYHNCVTPSFKAGPFCNDLIDSLSSQADSAASVVQSYLSNKNNFKFIRGTYDDHIQINRSDFDRLNVSPDAPGKATTISYRGAYADCYYGSSADFRFENTWYEVGLERHKNTSHDATGVSFIVTIREYIVSRKKGQSTTKDLVNEREEKMDLKFGDFVELELPGKFDMVHMKDSAECDDEPSDFAGCNDPYKVYYFKKMETYAPNCCDRSGFRGYSCEDNTGSYWSGNLEHHFKYEFRATGYVYKSESRSGGSASASASAALAANAVSVPAPSVSLADAITASRIAPAYLDIYADLDDSLKQNSTMLEIT